MKVGNLLHGAEERNRLAFHERGLLRLEHRDETHAGARGVVGLRGDEHVQQRFPVMVPPELLLLLRERAVEQRFDSLRHLFSSVCAQCAVKWIVYQTPFRVSKG